MAEKKAEIGLKAFRDVVENMLSSRDELLSRLIDPRRDLNKECGFPDTTSITVQDYKEQYDRNPIATRVVEVLPDETWKVLPDIYEDEDEAVVTEFEQAWNDVSKALAGNGWFEPKKGNPIWEYTKRVDTLSGIGHFGILLIGIDDGLPLDRPVEGVAEIEDAVPEDGTSQSSMTDSAQGTDQQYDEPIYGGNSIPAKGDGETRKLLYLRAFDESLVDPVRYESNSSNPRYGQPTMYRVTLNDPKEQHSGIGLPHATVNVHWTRVIHVADNLASSEIFGVPRQRSVFNQLLSLCKLYGGSAEMYWRGAFPGISLETHPQLGGDVEIDAASTRSQMENYMNGLQRYLALSGMSAKTLAPQVVDPTPQIEVQIEGICIKINVPKRIFMGSERGELSSSQDSKSWNDRISERQENYVTPRIIAPFVNRLIKMRVLPEPEQFFVVWPNLNTLQPAEQAAVSVQHTQALAAYVQGGVSTLVPPLEYLTKILGISQEEAKAILEAAIDRIKEEEDGEWLPGRPKPEPEPNDPIPSGEAHTKTEPAANASGIRQLIKSYPDPLAF